MGSAVKQFPATEDGCVYFYDVRLGRYRKICDILTFDELPASVKRQIKAAETIRLPTE
jgi:hypothetical protein